MPGAFSLLFEWQADELRLLIELDHRFSPHVVKTLLRENSVSDFSNRPLGAIVLCDHLDLSRINR